MMARAMLGSRAGWTVTDSRTVAARASGPSRHLTNLVDFVLDAHVRARDFWGRSLNTRFCAAVMAVVALTTACTSETPAAAPPSTTTTTTPVPPSPTELDQRAKAAIAPPGAFDALGGRVAQSTPANDTDRGAEREIVTTICRADSPLRVDSGTSVARSRAWTGGVNLFQRVHATSELPASVLLTSVRRQADLCLPGSSADQVAPNLPLAKPDGVDDLYGYCVANIDPELIPWSCHAVLARGTLITVVVASARTQSAAAAQLNSVLPIFTEPFVKA